MGIACRRALTDAEVRKELSTAMLKFLSTDKDTTKVKFEIQDVTYFKDKTFYECEYKVRMRVIPTGLDTTGIMTARVSRDFSTVKRKL